jgi:hydroxyethylthiazole kinase-like uncharacterized protein yjeF
LRSISALEMAAIDRNAMNLGMQPVVLMENAGRGVAKEIGQRRAPSTVLVLCGPGNNGGDGFVVARHLRNMGWKVSILEIGEPSKPEAKLNRQILLTGEVEALRIADSSEMDSEGMPDCFSGRDVIVDALLGTGSRGAPREPMASVIRAANSADAMRVAVDIPSGVNADTGEREGDFFLSDLTVTFHCAKTGLVETGQGVGELVVADIGIPPEAEARAGPGDLYFIRDARSEESHKGDNGTLLVVGGSREYHGAPAICGLAAMRTGIDLVYLAIPEALREIVSSHSPSLISRCYAGDRLGTKAVDTILELAARADAVCMGPGLGTEEETRAAVVDLVHKLGDKPLVLDADALKAVAPNPKRLNAATVVTPHGGEFRILTGDDLPPGLAERTHAVRTWSSQTSCTWAVKGRYDIIAQGDRLKVNGTGTACMTVGGTGDCLTGVIGGLLARGNETFRAAVAGCFVTGKAGELASGRRGCHLLPTDVVEEIPAVFVEHS